MTQGRRRVAVVTADTVSTRMAGPAIRAWNLAEALSQEHSVRLVTTGLLDRRPPDAFDVTSSANMPPSELAAWADVLVVQGWVLARCPALGRADRVVVADLYDPMHLEQLEQVRELSPERRLEVVWGTTGVLNEQIRRADFFLCASEKQRDFWLGSLAAIGRLNPLTYDRDPSLRQLIDVVPFGVGNMPPRRTGPGVRGVVAGIGSNDDLILWGGGIYNWFDPLTLIRAIAELRTTRPRCRLLFMGVRHPNTDTPQMEMEVAARRLAGDLGLTDKHVFFNEGWVPYDERQNVLLDADIGVSAHVDHLETAFSFRTRVLDYLWASLPVVLTAGDSLSDMVADRGLGLTVEAGDAGGLAAALRRLLEDRGLASRCRENIQSVLPELVWSRAVEPLMSFCRAPRPAPDRSDPTAARALRRIPEPPELTTGWRHDVRLAGRYLRDGGPQLLLRRMRSRLRSQPDRKD